MKIPLRKALWLAVGPANVDAAGHAVADWFDGHNCSGAADLIREHLQDQPDQPAPDAVPHNRPDTSLRAELMAKLATQREVLLNLCDRVDRLEVQADGLTPIERLQRQLAAAAAGGDKLDRLIAQDQEADEPAVPDDREPASVRAVFNAGRRWGHQPAPPAEWELGDLVAWLRENADDERQMCGISGQAFLSLDRAAELLQQRHPEPVPVSERLPEPSDCDGQGRCWLLSKVENEWRLVDVGNPGVPRLKYCFSHWLPATALPLPAGEGEE